MRKINVVIINYYVNIDIFLNIYYILSFTKVPEIIL